MIHEPMAVTIIEEEGGSHPEPELDQAWSDLDKLRWHAGVVAARTGLTSIRITGPYNDEHRHGIFTETTYGLNVGRVSCSSQRVHEVWVQLTGIELGATAMREQA